MQHVEDKGDGTVEVSGGLELDLLTSTETHELATGRTTFRCPYCDDDHAIAFINDHDTGTGRRETISVRWPQEAWAIAEFLLVQAFGVVKPGTWLAFMATVALEQDHEAPEVMN